MEEYIGIISAEYTYEIDNRLDNQEGEQLNLLIIGNQNYVGSFSESKMKIWVNPIDYRALYESEKISYLIKIQ